MILKVIHCSCSSVNVLIPMPIFFLPPSYLEVTFSYILLSISNQNSKLEFQFCVMYCPKLYIHKEFYFLILESNMGSYHKYSSKWVIKYENQRV